MQTASNTVNKKSTRIYFIASNSSERNQANFNNIKAVNVKVMKRILESKMKKISLEHYPILLVMKKNYMECKPKIRSSLHNDNFH